MQQANNESAQSHTMPWHFPSMPLQYHTYQHRKTESSNG